MSTTFAGAGLAWDRLLDTWRELQAPEGWRPELTAEGIHMTSPLAGRHSLIAARMHRALSSGSPDSCGVLQWLSVGIRATGSIYVPDVCVVLRDAVPRNSDPVPAVKALLAVEITSPSNGEHDRKKKWAYAHGDIPQYLLIDAFDEDGPAVSLFTEPVQGVYSRTVRVPFGQPVEVGEPFGIRLETSEF